MPPGVRYFGRSPAFCDRAEPWLWANSESGVCGQPPVAFAHGLAQICGVEVDPERAVSYGTWAFRPG